MILKGRIHQFDSLGGCSALGFGNMFFSEKELSVEIGIFNVIGICESDFTFLSSTKSNHGKVFQQLTSNSS